MVWIRLFLVLSFLSQLVNASELSNEEINYFSIIDLNNDGFITTAEINQSTNIIFQLIDINQDNKISLSEIEELKEIIRILK